MRIEGVETQVDFANNLHPNILIKDVSQPRDPQRWAFVLDAPRPEEGFSVHNNSLNNLLRGINERVFYINNKRVEPIQPTPDGFSQLKWFEDKFTTTTLRPWTLDQFAESYTGAQRTRYQKAVDSLALLPLSDEDTIVSTFVKCEKINFSRKEDPAPRVIQPRNPRFNAAIGRFIKPLEHLIYKRLRKLYGMPCVAKGFDTYQTGHLLSRKWNMFSNPCAISLDASRFDQHNSKAALSWTHSIYKKFCDDPEFSMHLSKLLYNRGRASCKDGFVVYEVEGRRMSGDMDTALGNCLLMTAMTFSLCEKLGIPHQVMDNGDDIVVIMDKCHEDAFRASVNDWYSNLGFSMKVEDTVYKLEHIEFCQMHPVFDGTEWRMVRNMTSLAKDLICCTNPQQVSTWLQAIGNGGISLTSGLPVFQEFYSFLQKYGHRKSKAVNWKHFRDSGFARLSGLHRRVAAPVTTQARLSFMEAFGVEIEQQLSLEVMYRNLKVGPLGINHTHFDAIAETAVNSPLLF